MSRKDKREQAAYHDSRRWLKRHSPRRSDPLFGLRERSQWADNVKKTVYQYPKWAKRQREDMAAGGVGVGRRGRSAEEVVMRSSSGPVAAVEAALERFDRSEQNRLKGILWGGQERQKADRALLGLFYRYVAVYMGYGRPRYDRQSS